MKAAVASISSMLAHTTLRYPDDDFLQQDPLPTANLNAITIAEILRENAELRRTLAELEGLRELAHRDALTGLWNRRYFETRMTEELARSRREPEGRFTLIIIDLNNMKQINDCFGHEAGDLTLKWVSSFLQNNLREYDVTCRLGGDEFALLLPGASADDSKHLLSRLHARLVAANTTRDIPVGLSFGAATYPEQGTTHSELFVHADEAMYKDKRRQRGTDSRLTQSL
jgi:diguanylate cyclase (GGDEF)-like protein